MPAPTPALDIRRLGPADLALLRALNALFASAFEDPASYAHSPPDDAYVQQVLSQPHVFALVALQAGAVVGGLVAYELPKLEQARSEVYLYDLAVAAHARRQGVATGLIRSLQAMARERGAWVVFVQADHSDPPAIALYEKLGLREEVLHFDLPLPSTG